MCGCMCIACHLHERWVYVLCCVACMSRPSIFSVKLLESGRDTELLVVLSGPKLFAYWDLFDIGGISVKNCVSPFSFSQLDENIGKVPTHVSILLTTFLSRRDEQINSE